MWLPLRQATLWLCRYRLVDWLRNSPTICRPAHRQEYRNDHSGNASWENGSCETQTAADCPSIRSSKYLQRLLHERIKALELLSNFCTLILSVDSYCESEGD